jgi:hypothetical protein
MCGLHRAASSAQTTMKNKLFKNENENEKTNKKKIKIYIKIYLLILAKS